ncbi:ATP-binding protein [Streptomyces sp. NPDC059698]|uniref:sensor histidine kinase n=1 Tax=unclassified Streptomyces TaxID=2593676 RepID=UPI0009677D62|nr:HAMP domain-containing sensor histidine kinase [Streptomyces sp. CB02366]OKJ38583.1 histidine kinase [Streptomyces sp. CB02366]TVP35377.1 two-component sensor histidine kinase [Streptomyces griseus subsp. griseus]
MDFLNPRALRWKIAALAAAACCAVAAVVGFLVHDATRERGLRVGTDRTLTRLTAAEREFGRTGEAPADIDVRTRAELPEPLARDLPDRPAGETDGPSAGEAYATWYDVDPPNWYWMWGAAAVGGDRYLVVREDMSTEVRSLQLLDRSIVTSVLAALLVVVPLAALATEPINRRLRHGALTARRIADGDLDARIGPAGRARDEITAMSAAVDDMATALQRKLENERRFTADVAHELRTPLMGLVTAAGLLPEDDEAAALVRDRLRALNALVEDLLEISRLDAGVERARLDPVPLGELVADVVRRTGTDTRVAVEPAGASATEGAAGAVEPVEPIEATGASGASGADRADRAGGAAEPGEPVGAVGVVETDPRRVERIVVNLVANAHRHGAAPVEVTVAGARIAVRDHGPGFPPELLEHGPQRFRTGASERGRGHGLGLTVAQGQAEVLGARLTFANAPGGGAVATLDLSPPPV